MDWDAVGNVALGVGGVAAVVIKYVLDHRARGGRWHRIGQLLDLVERLPEESAARERLRSHIEGTVSRLIEDEEQKKRDPSGVAVAAVLLAIASYLAWLSLSPDGNRFWLGFAVPTGILGLVGFFESISRRLRDERGHVIREAKSMVDGDPPDPKVD